MGGVDCEVEANPFAVALEMILETTNPRGRTTHTDCEGTRELIEAAAAVDRARLALRDAEARRYDARQAVIAAEQHEQDVRDRVAKVGPGTNSGHGHVWPRPDGLMARCGGPAMCPECKADQERFGG